MLIILVCHCIPLHGFSQEKASIQGYVIDSLGKPIANANIIFQPDYISASTDAKGFFQTRKLFLGEYQYQLSAVGYDMISGKIDFQQKTKVHRFQLEKSANLIEEVSVQAEVTKRPTLINPLHASMPVTVIDRKALDLLGSRRLDEVLREQTGMAIVNNISGGSRSTGVQMQGLSSQYIMVLIDGQPVLGRQSGNLDLSRIQVSNIERIEIIKGASSCLYGNDALGGAINIITRFGSSQPQVHLQGSYGSYETLDFTAEAESNFNQNKGYVLLSGNYYRTAGFNNNKRYMEAGTTIPPYTNYALQGKVRHQLGSPQQFLGLNMRLNQRFSEMTRKYGADHEIRDKQDELDLNSSLSFDKKWNSRWKSLSNYYFSTYRSAIDVQYQASQSSLSSDHFNQNIHKLEQQAAYHGSNLQFTLGAVGQLETMSVNNNQDTRDQTSFGVYAQGSYTWPSIAQLTAGLRYDHTLNYGSQLSPSMGINIHLTEQLSWKTGIASGFKAPDFRTRYQVFYNPTANYYVLGNEVLLESLAQMEQEGTISEIRKAIVQKLSQPLKAEKNISLNSGISYKPFADASMDVNVFYHRMRDQINSVQVATGERNMAIYSFQNLPQAVNKGIEINSQVKLMAGLNFNAGYQYLIAKDLSVIDSIKAKVWPYNQNIHDPKTGQSYPVKPSDYWGLENRSRHQFHLGLSYAYTPWQLTFHARAIFRGKYPFMDINGNQFIDKYDVFVEDHILYHAGVEKKFSKTPLSIRFNMENISNYINYLIPGQLGRMSSIGLSYRFIKN